MLILWCCLDSKMSVMEMQKPRSPPMQAEPEWKWQKDTKQTIMLRCLLKQLISHKSTNIRLIRTNYRAAFVHQWVALQISCKQGGALIANAKESFWWRVCTCVCAQEMGPGFLEEESCLPGTEDYGTIPCGMLEAVGVWEGWALNQFREQSHLSKSLTTTVCLPHTLLITPEIFIPSHFFPLLQNV